MNPVISLKFGSVKEIMVNVRFKTDQVIIP